jgi:hypothetical protein
LSLRLDAVACAVCVPVLVIGSGPLSALLGLPGALLLGAGLFLLPFSVFLWLTSSPANISPSAVLTAVAVNVLWVLASVAVVLLFSPTVWGVVFVLVQAVAVAGLLVVEALALRRAGATTTRTTGAAAGERTTRGTV